MKSANVKNIKERMPKRVPPE